MRGVFKTPDLEFKSPSEMNRRDLGQESAADEILSVADAGESLKQWEDELSREYIDYDILNILISVHIYYINSGEEGWIPESEEIFGEHDSSESILLSPERH